jgi:hypothetical protein
MCTGQNRCRSGKNKTTMRLRLSPTPLPKVVAMFKCLEAPLLFFTNQLPQQDDDG